MTDALAFVSVVIVVALAVPSALLWGARKRWGVRVLPVGAGEGAYREGVVHRAVRRRVPLRIAASVLAASAWGAITLCALVPAGGLAGLMLLAHGDVLAGLLFVAIVFSGLLHALGLFAASGAIAQRAEGASPTARRAAWHGVLHHTSVWVSLSIATLVADHEAAPAIALLLAPCAIGVAVAWGLRCAAAHLDGLVRDDSAHA